LHGREMRTCEYRCDVKRAGCSRDDESGTTAHLNSGQWKVIKWWPNSLRGVDAEIMAGTLRILAILGSLRQGSYNRALLKAAHEVAPAGVTLEDFTLEGIPPYNQDEEANLPPRVAELKSKIRAADAILIVTPEYNYSIPGVLKNAIDWSSRRGPEKVNVWEGKPVGMMGASGGAQGTSRAQYHLRQVFVYLDAQPLNRPEVMVADAAQKFDADGKLTDEKTRGAIQRLLEALVRWARLLEAGRTAG